MKHYFFRILTIWTVIVLSTCSINKLNEEKTVITLEKELAGNPILISLTKADHWSHKFTPGPFIIHVYPQMVFWMEDLNGNFLCTIYITDADGTYTKNATKQKLDDKFFLMALPVWAHRAMDAGLDLPTSEEPYPDAITSATPESSFDLKTSIGDISTPFFVYAEINKSMDYNATYTEEKTDWIGQPSLVYAVKVNSTEKNQKYILRPAGHSGEYSENQTIQTDFNGIDTALEMVKEINIEFQ